MPNLNTNLPDGTSVDNVEIADLATQSREAAAEQGRLSWLDLLLEQAMAISATVSPDALIDALDEVRSLAAQWQDQIRLRLPVVTA